MSGRNQSFDSNISSSVFATSTPKRPTGVETCQSRIDVQQQLNDENNPLGVPVEHECALEQRDDLCRHDSMIRTLEFIFFSPSTRFRKHKSRVATFESLSYRH